MLEKFVEEILKKLLQTQYRHLLRPGVVYARIIAAEQGETFAGAEIELELEDGSTVRGHRVESWYSYTLQILDQFGAEDTSYSLIPGVESKLALAVGAVVAVGLPNGDVLPVIIGEVQL